MTADTSTAVDSGQESVSLRVRVQKFGTFLSNMIMPNIPAIIAWGLFTAFFIPVGWWPNEQIATAVGPSIFYVLPVLIAYTGGKIVYGVRGGVVGGFAVIGVIMATSHPLFIGDAGGSPMFLGAMIMGPLTAWLMKKADNLWRHLVKPGFEMLVDNFSAGILGMLMAIAGMFLLAPPLRWFIRILGSGVDFLVENSILPLTSIFIEPAKVLFLNNAINQGVLTPLGIAEATENGKSILFLLEANPAAGLGLLLAYSVFGKGTAKATAPGAAIVHFLGGIHEVYFPYVLMKPKLLIAMIAGGMTQIFINVLFSTGLRAPAAPGSIFAVYAQTAPDSFVGVTLSVIGGATVTFLIAGFLLRVDKSEEGDLSAATQSMEAMKGKKSIASSLSPAALKATHIKNIVFACDAGMGSSAMGASVLRKKIKDAGHPDVTVVNKSIANLEDNVDLVVTHQDLTARAKQRTPSAIHVSVDNFMASPKYDEIVHLLDEADELEPQLAAAGAPAAAAGTAGATATATKVDAASGLHTLLPDQAIVLSGTARTRDEAIDEAGQLLVASGAVDQAYVRSMHERETSVSTYVGNNLAIPHGTNEAKQSIRRTGLSFIRYPQGIDWKGDGKQMAHYVVGIAGAGDDHLSLLGSLAHLFLDKEKVAALEAAKTKEEVAAILDSVSLE